MSLNIILSISAFENKEEEVGNLPWGNPVGTHCVQKHSGHVEECWSVQRSLIHVPPSQKSHAASKRSLAVLEQRASHIQFRWLKDVTPATWKAEAGGWPIKVNLGKFDSVSKQEVKRGFGNRTLA